MGTHGARWRVGQLSTRLLKRIGCFQSDVDFGVTTHLAAALQSKDLSNAVSHAQVAERQEVRAVAGEPRVIGGGPPPTW